MGVITNIRLSNVRSHTSGEFIFAHDMNAIVGPNGSGKTTILEALYLLLQGSSFKGTVADIAQYGSNQFRTQLTYASKSTTHQRSLGFQQVERVMLKKWSVDQKKYARLPVSARLPVVLFEPDLGRLISGGPERRRNYIDQIASQVDIEVAVAQNRFAKVLKQRNHQLKYLREQNSKKATEDLFVWNTQLAHQAQTIVTARKRIITQLQKEATRFYQQLGGTDDIVITYLSSVSEDTDSYGARLLQFLDTSLIHDIRLGHTSYGPHRDDVEILLADQPAVDRASRGEIRTIVVALKLLETELLSEHYKDSGIKPILLLDDVLSELDLVHQERVLQGLKDHQVFLTTTDAHALNADVHTIFLE